MKPKERERGVWLRTELVRFHDNTMPLPGIIPDGRLDVLVDQLVDSLRRIEFIHHIRDHDHDVRRMDPASDFFDPLKAAVLHGRQRHADEAFWLVFLATHFGKHAIDGWRLCRDIYGKLGDESYWTWDQIIDDPAAFGIWLRKNIDHIRNDGVSRRFSNHRKYESLIAPKGAGTPEVIESFVDWVMEFGSNQNLIVEAHKAVGQHPGETFDRLYREMNRVRRFGRLAKFDYLTMLGKLGLAPIEPQLAYLGEATGPLRGARLLFDNDPDSATGASELEDRIRSLNVRIDVGMQAWEDSLCNWQKSPTLYRYFRG
ncbi:hypothetical protein [Mesorhizobium carmichaelinearum]|uniref:alpha-glutamyl/putrescinyl thymine pyrophosphorylase clade 3 protein n=1 Tax=Mesorhizobium carmichaelinearum TaxID=1208188 RepID=UPI0011815292|nr:hypothetical protein [Mesorhizobium carmichaelinearum]